MDASDGRADAVQEDGKPQGCNRGCLAVVAACIAIDAVAFWALWQALNAMAEFFAWLLSLMAAA